jgi:hypothetical protein
MVRSGTSDCTQHFVVLSPLFDLFFDSQMNYRIARKFAHKVVSRTRLQKRRPLLLVAMILMLTLMTGCARDINVRIVDQYSGKPVAGASLEEQEVQRDLIFGDIWKSHREYGPTKQDGMIAVAGLRNIKTHFFVVRAMGYETAVWLLDSQENCFVMRPFTPTSSDAAQTANEFPVWYGEPPPPTAILPIRDHLVVFPIQRADEPTTRP